MNKSITENIDNFKRYYNITIYIYLTVGYTFCKKKKFYLVDFMTCIRVLVNYKGYISQLSIETNGRILN